MARSGNVLGCISRFRINHVYLAQKHPKVDVVGAAFTNLTLTPGLWLTGLTRLLYLSNVEKSLRGEK